MACLRFFLAALLLVSSQCLVQSRLIQRDDLENEFNNAIANLRGEVEIAVYKGVDFLEPMLQQIVVAAKFDIIRALQELDAYERRSLQEAEDIVRKAGGNMELCYEDEAATISDLTQLTRSLTESCVSSTMQTAEGIYDDGIAQLLAMYKLISEHVVNFEICGDDDDSCKIKAITAVKEASVQVHVDAAEITEDTRERMDNVIPNYEDRCIGNNRSFLAIEVEKIFLQIKECVK